MGRSGSLTAVLHEQMEEVLDLRGRLYEEEASNHSPVPWLKTVVLNGVRKGVTLITSGAGREDERWAGNGPLPSEASK